MEPTEVSRSIYVGSDVHAKYKITSLCTVPLGNIDILPVGSIEEYESGCSTCGKECYGHMCRTPSGIVLVPQSLAMKKGETSNEYLDAAKLAFSGKSLDYKDYLASINKTKRGHMRKDILGSSVLGSARLIIAPACNIPTGELYIPRIIAASLRTPYEVIDESSGYSTGIVGERPVEDGDRCMLWRPPSLTYSSIQPYKVRIHDAPVMKIPIQDAGLFHADFDGDEMHICMIYSRSALKECNKWRHTVNSGFDNAFKRIVEEYQRLPGSHLPQSFISYTNMTMKEVMERAPPPMFSGPARMKAHNITETGQRFVDPESVKASFVAESIRGTVDVTRQQLFQGPMGLKSRIAKLAAAGFFRASNMLYAQTSHGAVPVAPRVSNSYGVPAMRGISFLCAFMQQSALDSHRAQKSDIPSHDLISDMISGGDVTAVAVECDEGHYVDAIWKAWKDGISYRLIEKHAISSLDPSKIRGAFSPWVLRTVPDPFPCALGGISMVASYFGIQLSEDEAHDMASMFSYQCDASDHPITTIPGMRARDLGWMEKWMAGTYNDINKLSGSAIVAEYPNTMVSSSMLGRFTSHKTT